MAEGVDFRAEFGTGLRAALARAHGGRDGNRESVGTRSHEDPPEPVSPELVLVSPDLRYLIVPQAAALAGSPRPQS